MERPPFGLLLERLIRHRQWDAGALSRAAGVSKDELQKIADGRRPSAELLMALAPALNLHVADLLVIAGRQVPDDLAPLDSSRDVRWYVQHLVRYALCLPVDQRSGLRRMVRELPQRPRQKPYVPWRWFDPDKAGAGALVANLLYANRNLAPGSAAQALGLSSRGRMYVSAATVVGIGAGRVELTPTRLADLSTLIDIPAGDLAAITGIPLPDGYPPEDPAADDAAALLWDVRRLSAWQLWQVCVRAEEMYYALPATTADPHPDTTGFRISHHPPKTGAQPG